MQLEQDISKYLTETYTAAYTSSIENLNFSTLENYVTLGSKDLLAEQERSKAELKKITEYRVPLINTEILINKFTQEWYEKSIASENAAIGSKKQELEDKRVQFEQEYNNLIQSYHKAIESRTEVLKNKLQEIYYPIYQIKTSKDALEDFAKANQLSLTYYTVDYENSSIEDIKHILTLSSKAIDEALQGRKGVTSILQFMYLPLVRPLHKNEQVNSILSALYFGLLFLLLIFAEPYCMAAISLLIIVQSLVALSRAKANHKLISIAYSLYMDFDHFDEYIDGILSTDEELDRLSTELVDLEYTPVEDYVEEHIKHIEEELAKMYEGSISDELHNTINEATNATCMIKYKSQVNGLYERFTAEYKRKFSAYNEYFLGVAKELNSRMMEVAKYNSTSRNDLYFDDLMSDIKKSEKDKVKAKQKVQDLLNRAKLLGGPGIPVTINYFLDTSFTTTKITDRSGELIYGYNRVTLPYKNILFQWHDLPDRSDRLDQIRLFLCSMLANVRENFLDVTIIDPEGLGKDLSEFLNKDTQKYIRVVTTDYTKVLEQLYEKAKSNMMVIGNKSFNKYNEDNSNENKTTLEYTLVIILSSSGLASNKVFQEFKKYSTDMGVWIWLLHADESNFTDKEGKIPPDIPVLLDFPIVIKSDDVAIVNDGTSIPLYKTSTFEQRLTADTYTVQNAVKEFELTMRKRKPDIIWYEEEYRTVFIPDNKIWTYSSAPGIELHFGFFEGDRSDNNPEWFGSDGVKPVHCLMCGETGAGKSATINQVLANLLHMYSPEELSLIMIDFKNVEFGMYTDKSNPNVTPPSIIPHARIIAGTTDGEYALSVFEYALREMRRRQSELGIYQFQSIADWNSTITFQPKDVNNMSGKEKTKWDLKQRMIADGKSIMPRLIILCDEFQVMFTEVEDRIVDQIKIQITSISKLARFAGCHLWFTSQSMKGTMSQDILDQFMLRACLRCSKDVSDDVLGNPAAYEKLRGRGAIYTNCDKGKLTSNHRYVIPFAPNDYIKEYLAKLARKTKEDVWTNFKGEKVKGHIEYGALFYDEKRKHPLTDTTAWYARTEVQKLNTLILVGERTYFSEDKIPLHVILQKADGEHVMICGNNRDDRFNLANTFLYGCESHNIEFIVSCPDPELADLLDLTKRVKPEYQKYISPNPADDLLAFVEEEMNARTEDPSKTNTPIFVFGLMWDKLVGIGVGEDWNTTDKFKDMLQKCASLGIHFIIVAKLAKAFNSFLPFIGNRICAQSDENTSYALCETGKCTKLSQDPDIARMALLYKDNSTFKFKIYQSPIDETKVMVSELKIS